MPDNVNHPEHYTKGGIECIDAIEAMVADMPPQTALRLGNVLKYIWRHHHKGGVESLRKAEWYLRREIASAEVRALADEVEAFDIPTADKFAAMATEVLECNWRTADDLRDGEGEG